MKVLVLHSELGVLRGGGENFTRNLFTAFAQRGHRVAAAFAADRQGKYLFPLPSCIDPIPITGWWHNNLGQAILSAIGRYIPAENGSRKTWDRIQSAMSWRVFRWHKQRFQRRAEEKLSNMWNDFDVVYVHGDAFLARMAARYRPTILRLPGPVSAELAPMLQALHAVCANGDALKRIRIFMGDDAIELPIGINSDLFKPAPSSVRDTLNWTRQHRVIGYVGRLTHLKGVDLLTAAFRETLRIHPDTRLIIIGSGEEENNLRSDLSKEVAYRLVHFEQDVAHEKLAEWYRAMDLLVMPSRYENFSNTILEALSCGIPFVASDIGGNRLLKKTGAGWFFEPGSPSSLSACLEEILENAADMQARGNAGRCYIRSCHSWMSSAQRLEEIITCLRIQG